MVVRLREGAFPTIYTVRLGSVLPLTGSATGLVYLAFLNPAFIGPVLERERAVDPVPVTQEQLAVHVAATRTNGFAAVDGSVMPGLVAISCPVFDFQNDVACSITVTGTNSMITNPKGRFVERRCAECASISADFGSTRGRR